MRTIRRIAGGQAEMRPGKGLGALAPHGIGAGGALACVAAGLMIFGAGTAGAQAATRSAGTVVAPVGVTVGSSAPLTALSITSGAITCVQSGAAVDADGAVGVLAPQLGTTVIRGSAATSPSVTWVVVPREKIGAEVAALTSVCLPAR